MTTLITRSKAESKATAKAEARQKQIPSLRCGMTNQKNEVKNEVKGGCKSNGNGG
jgi:hypothetical protein